jgi:hypothetical protein
MEQRTAERDADHNAPVQRQLLKLPTLALSGDGLNRAQGASRIGP